MVVGNKRVRTFEDLECWRACRELRLFVSKEVPPVLPREKKFRLGDQLLRATPNFVATPVVLAGKFSII